MVLRKSDENGKRMHILQGGQEMNKAACPRVHSSPRGSCGLLAFCSIISLNISLPRGVCLSVKLVSRFLPSSVYLGQSNRNSCYTFGEYI